MTADTPGKRVYLIRLALGDGFKTPMPMADFAALLTRRCRVKYDSSMISRMESGDRKVTLDDAPRLASLDPMKRGRDWVAWGNEKAPAEAEAEDFTVGAVALTPAQKARAVETAAETERTRRASESARLKRRRSNGEP